MTDKEYLEGETECPVYGDVIDMRPLWCLDCDVGTDGTAVCPFRKYERRKANV